jgi:hypothetical protein
VGPRPGARRCLQEEAPGARDVGNDPRDGDPRPVPITQVPVYAKFSRQSFAALSEAPLAFPWAYRGEGTSLSHLGNDRVSTATRIVCPTCGALLVQQHSLHNAATGESPWIGQCHNQHWWLRSPVFGWMPIDPGAVAVDQAATPVQEE